MAAQKKVRKRRMRHQNKVTEPPDVPHLALSHGQAIWLLSELGFRGSVSVSTFNYYIKSLRKLGVPFEQNEARVRAHRHAVYIFEDLMELVVALLLRVYGTLPDAVASGLRDYREDLRPIYRRAYVELAERNKPTARITNINGEQTSLSGLYLDLNIRYCAGKMIAFGPPKALSPFQAASIYSRAEVPARAYLPFNISRFAQLIIAQTASLPSIPRGRTARRIR